MNELDKYLGIYGSEGLPGYGHSNHGARSIAFLEKWQPRSLVDVGCGFNEYCQAIRQKFSIRAVGVDFACPGADIKAAATSLPFADQEFDVLTSFDCLEHLLPAEVEVALLEMARVSARFVFSISYAPSKCRWKGQGLHPTVHSEQWWISQIMRAGGAKLVKVGKFLTGVWQRRLPIKPGDSVVLVGNGPSVFQSTRGKMIDEFDHIVRFNRFATAGFERWVGSRTTLWSATPLAGKDGIRHDECLSINEGALVGVASNVHDVPDHYRREVTEALCQRAQWMTGFRTDSRRRIKPSSGLLVIAYLAEIVGVHVLHAVGFDHFAGTIAHYWDTDHGIAGDASHDGQVESRFFQDLVSSGRVVLL
jgi:SAM-dependent methyltransferase